MVLDEALWGELLEDVRDESEEVGGEKGKSIDVRGFH